MSEAGGYEWVTGVFKAVSLLQARDHEFDAGCFIHVDLPDALGVGRVVFRVPGAGKRAGEPGQHPSTGATSSCNNREHLHDGNDLAPPPWVQWAAVPPGGHTRGHLRRPSA